jgi:hypothetical protein
MVLDFIKMFLNFLYSECAFKKKIMWITHFILALNFMPQGSFDLGRRIATEKEIKKSPMGNHGFRSLTFDDSSNFLIYPTLLGIKVSENLEQSTVAPSTV